MAENRLIYIIFIYIYIYVYIYIYIYVGANHLEGTIETVWVGPMAQFEDGQTKL